ncbi:unnamed protein product [Prorocentrum cordatum]|uniref:CBM20 domain-containing protein n=1 Tax=Prorocentrum cordatum TaxID=2364126 RepID=A0ABN9VQG7_9DINO|nr:unnamed protein product [Polarella glacialis]
MLGNHFEMRSRGDDDGYDWEHHGPHVVRKIKSKVEAALRVRARAMADASSTRVRFSVVSFSPKGTCPELGDWRVDGAPAMSGRLCGGRLQSEPDFYWVGRRADVELGRGGRVEYKFVEVDGEGTRWEQLGDGGNRVLQLDERPPPDGAAGPLLLPVERFAGGSESDHTGRFYSGVKDRGARRSLYGRCSGRFSLARAPGSGATSIT